MIYSRKILVVIPARIGSKGIKKKNLCKIGKLTLIEHTFRQLNKINFIDKICLSTDSAELKKIAIRNNIFCQSLRPKKISGDNAKTSDALIHVIKDVAEKFDYIVEIHPTHPFRKTSTIRKAIIEFARSNGKYDSLISISQINGTSHPDFVIKKNKANNISFLKSPNNFNRHNLKPRYQSAGIVLISKYKNFLKEKKMCNGKCYGYVITDKKELINIDTYEDLNYARYLYKKNGNKIY